MDKLLQGFLLSITIAIPAFIGLYRYTVIDKQYRPFVWICCLLTLSELLMYTLIRMKVYTFMSYNLVLPFTCLFYLLLFKRWGTFGTRKYMMPVLMVSFLIIWIADHFLINGYRLNARTSYCRIYFAALLVLLAVNTINKLIVSERNNLLTNSRFLVCGGLIVYYTYRIIVDAFSIKGMSQGFLLMLGDFNRYLLVGLNLLFAIAVLWIPTKKSYTIQF